MYVIADLQKFLNTEACMQVRTHAEMHWVAKNDVGLGYEEKGKQDENLIYFVRYRVRLLPSRPRIHCLQEVVPLTTL